MSPRESPQLLAGVHVLARISPEGEPYKFMITVNPLSTLDGHRFARLDRPSDWAETRQLPSGRSGFGAAGDASDLLG
jgi:hypothetical protein